MKKLCRYGLCLLIGLSTIACTGPLFKNYGRFEISEKSTRTLESYAVQPEYRYYVSGADLYPNALMGLHRDHRLDPETLWKEITMSPERLRQTVENIQIRSRQCGSLPVGYDLFDDQDRPIGFWYSMQAVTTLVRMQEDGTVRIDTPDLETYTKHEESLIPTF